MTSCPCTFSSILTSLCPFCLSFSLSIFNSFSFYIDLELLFFIHTYPTIYFNPCVCSSDIIMSPASSSRWCPTPEQLMILEEMYRSGIRTPNATQIQHITAHLSFYGKIEGKNVFYWFQNHKARERQKLRRKLGIQLQRQRQQQQQLYFPPHQLHQSTQSSPHLFHYFGSPTSPPFQQLSSFNSTKFLPLQGGGGGGGCEDASTQMMNYTWKLDMPNERVETEKSLMGTYGRDWMMMMVDLVAPPPPPSPCSAAAASRPPLKTLQLFPITATNLKEECNPSN